MSGRLASLRARALAKNRKDRMWKRVVGTLGCIAVFCTVSALALPAITASDVTYCGKEEHQHSDVCSEQVLVCGLEESEGFALGGHSHSESCYQTEDALICILEESEDVLDEGGEVLSTGHTHSNECYESTQKLICGTEESSGQIVGDHVHVDACWEQILACYKSEHTHDQGCFADKTADVETRGEWEATLPSRSELTGVWADDVLAVAESQLGYQESQRNYVVDEEKGYNRGWTRYGEWYGDAYGDWCAMFVSFCLHYAGIPEEAVPQDANCQNWISTLEESGQGLWRSPDEYQPQPGDLVFFDWNADGVSDHVGIASSAVACAGDVEAFEVIEGNSNNQVERGLYALGNKVIMGFGQMPQNPDLAQEADENPVRLFARTGSATDLSVYLEGRGGSISFTLTDEDSEELPKNEEGNLVVQPEVGYILTMHASSPNGFEPGLYQYQLPAGLNFANDTGSFVVDGVDIGEWSVGQDGLVVFRFNEEANKKTEVLISAVMGVTFTESESPIDFDGRIIVTIQPPEEEELGTYLGKWGMQGDGSENKPDRSKIYWSIQIFGNEESVIPGSVLTDAAISGNHTYTESDTAGGLSFGVSEADPETGQELDWHRWVVYPGDPALSWGQDGWEYVIPEKVECEYCGELVLGSNGWKYYVEYSSTPDATDVIGGLAYQNKVAFDNQEAYGWVSVQHGASTADVRKAGAFLGDAEGGRFVWEVSAAIPGMKAGEKADYCWYMIDQMSVFGPSGDRVGYVRNDMDLATVRAIHDGQVFEVPNIKDATEDDLFAWENSWTDERDGVPYLREILIYSRCSCTEDTCQLWYEGGCGGKRGYLDADGKWHEPETSAFCQCWAVEGDTTFTFSYETSDMGLLEEYGGVGNVLENYVTLYKRIKDENGNWVYSNIGNADVPITVPGVFKKELTEAFDGYTASYTIAVNEAKLDLTEDSPLIIHDVMSETLAYISGSLVIAEEGIDGTRRTLEQGVDYSVSYDGTGSEVDASGNPVHILDVKIFAPGSAMYVLDYEATLVIPEGTTQGVKYSNYASVSLFGRTITSVSEDKIHANINISAKTYRFEIQKITEEGAPLSGATFGLYNQNGGLMASGQTDENGSLLFETNVVEGVILRQHMPYYIQEIDAPDGYVLNDRRHWLYFCDDASGSCAYDPVIPEIKKISGQETSVFRIANELAIYELPRTGSLSSSIFAGGGLVLTTAGALVLALRNKRKRRCE